MKIFLILFLSLYGMNSFGQDAPEKKRVRADPNTIVVKDSSGTVYPHSVWQKLIMSGRYKIKKAGNGSNNDFLLVKVSDDEYEKIKQNLPKPAASGYFKNGEKFRSFSGRDMTGKNVNTKKMAGQILVINFWFTTCAPCIMEIPELNDLADEYKDDSTVQFIAVGLEERYKIADFLSIHPFKYRVVPYGKDIVPGYGIRSYPTHVVVSPEGRVYFHTSGYGMLTVDWIKKSVEELKAMKAFTAESTAAPN